ncbi:hypothetical protein [Granulicella tundricola]|uniref:Uncharacterized protein n=1 Tax=Granulicella tundricola (strain ATCC BAA-1859 / DSM 23138 / MP5ACTX9) TaxID=1198114 RepID=E8X1B2_GRATM|nr:hypothetical protein [Granulicella tundricola]ADW69066.1 hypothetical protein AciX9_2021 [Granulicella tundricola MP5ACTX9]
MSYLFINTTAVLDSTNTAFFTSLSGRTCTPPLKMGIEEKSSLLRGFLAATIQGLSHLRDTFGNGNGYSIDVCIPNEAIAREIREHSSRKSLLHGDDDALWADFHRLSTGFELKFISSPGESGNLRTFYGWNSTPFILGELEGEVGYTPAKLTPAAAPEPPPIRYAPNYKVSVG